MPHRLRFIATGLVICLVGCGRPHGPPQPAPAAITGDAAKAEELSGEELTFGALDYPQWRNIDLNGVESERPVPVEWSAASGVVWSTPIPGEGHSSPIISQGLVFLTTADEQAQTQSVLALDATTGNQKWLTQVHQGNLPRKHPKNSHASATPASDGERVYAAFINGNALHVTALNASDGRIAWTKEVGPFNSEHGYGSSVLLWKGMIFVNGDSRGSGYEAALDRHSGDIIWRSPRPGVGGHGSYATPIIAELAGKPQLIQSGLGKVTSYDPLTGKELWHCEGPTEVTANTLAVHGNNVIVSGGYPDKEILCIKADGSGNVTKSHVVWRNSKNVAYVPSPTVTGNKLYTVTDNGILCALDVQEGEMLWQERLGGNFSASPLVVGSTFYIPNEGGEVFVFKTEPEYQLLSRNQLDDEGGMASLTVSESRLFIRTRHKLYCIGK